MTVKQLSIFLENKSGRLTEVLEALGEEKINIKALTIADTSEYGILRMIVSNPDKAYSLLKEKGFSANLTDVVSISTPSEAGSFARVIKIFSDAGISIEYMYAFPFDNKTMLVMRAENNFKAIEVIQSHNLELLRGKDFYDL